VTNLIHEVHGIKQEVLIVLKEEQLQDNIMLALDISLEEAFSILHKHAICPNNQVDK
jgi:hypothetical protein